MALVALDWQDPVPDACRGGALSIGNFDGVHQGHAALLDGLRQRAAVVPGPAVALTFDPHPLQVLRGLTLPVLTPLDERARLLHELGADHVLVLSTTPALLQRSPEEFFREVVLERLAARAVVEGNDFGFGRNRAGNIDTLAGLCADAGIALLVVPPVLIDGEPVSSSRVRTALQQGDVAAARSLLGRPYRLRGAVGEGARRGRTLGFPTANLESLDSLLPGDGVYAVRVPWEGRNWPGAANIGPNPTFGEDARKVEVHLIGFSGDLYGRTLSLDFLDRLRDTRPFRDVQELREQLQQDIDDARRIAGETS
jgi:riboflavin kinase/FMN adenylyltransferase